MESNITELIFIIDKSGSMSGLEKDTIGGFNSMVEKQRNEKGTCHISTIFFADNSSVIHNRKNIANVALLTPADYVPSGSTALLDAIGDAINHTVRVQRYLSEDERAHKVVFVIITDGEENASRRFSIAKIKQMISLEKEKYGWEFMFLGANIDAIATASNMGISADRATNFVCDEQGVDINFRCMSRAVSSLRQSGRVDDDWAGEISRDYAKRGRK